MKRGAWLTALLLGACHPPPTKQATTTTIRSCAYRVTLHADGRANVDASCVADGPMAFRVSHGFLTRVLSASARGKSGRFAAADKHLSYSVDLARLAGHKRDFDRAARVGASFVAPLSSVLLVPEPLTTEIAVSVRVVSQPPLDVSVGLTRGPDPDSYRLMAHEIPVATYFSFGKLARRTLDVSGATLEVTELDGALDRSFDELNGWIQTSANAVRDFYGAFPVPRASITVIPTPRRDSVLFGKVLPESEPGIALLVGQRASRKALYSDWILVHELFHLGFPSFFGEGKWLDEGLATYYEPIIRVRAGLYTETELWDGLESSMSQGLRAFTETGLERANDYRGVYWGGAIACLVADVAARQRKLDAGLEVGLRAVRDAGGNASQVWSLQEVIGAVDQALGAPTLASIAKAHGQHGSAFDLRALFSRLGVNRDAQGAVQLSDSAPLSAIRRAITAKP